MRNKVLFILHIPPPVHGSSMVGKTIKESPVINQAFECSFINLGTSRNVGEIGKNPMVKVGRYLNILGKVLKQLISNKPKLCYLAITVKGIAFYKDSLIALLVKMFGVRLVYHFHNKGVKTKRHNVIYNLLYRIVFNNSHAILLSKYLYSDIEKYFTLDKVFFCPNGIPEIQSKCDKNQSNAATLKNDISKPVEILFLSNLIESKGVFVLLDACKILKSRGYSFHCTFVGSEGDITAQQLNDKIDAIELVDHVHYVGKKYGIEKEQYFSKCDIFVFPTYYECLPLVLLEAMQHCLPIVSTFEGGIPDVVDDGKTGFLVPQKDPKALADKLEILIQSPTSRYSMGKAGRQRFEKMFTLEMFENNLLNILNKIIG